MTGTVSKRWRRKTERSMRRGALCAALACGMLVPFAGAVVAQSDGVLRPPLRVLPAVNLEPDALPPVDAPAVPVLRANPVAPAAPAPAAPAAPARIVEPAAVAAPATPGVPLLAQGTFAVRPPARRAQIPRTRWQHMEGHALWTRAALSALKDHGKPLVDMVPGDIANWCPAYATNADAQRRAFWVGYMSALAKYESTYKPWAVGGGGRWFGLLQILPATARGYECNVGTGEALKSGAANLSCGVRIMAHTVARDGVIHGRDSKWRGVSADWGPMRNAGKRAEMAGWLKQQNYCVLADTVRPQSRP